jgi:hypothetical protein
VIARPPFIYSLRPMANRGGEKQSRAPPGRVSATAFGSPPGPQAVTGYLSLTSESPV